jgi:hypothetical protein
LLRQKGAEEKQPGGREVHTCLQLAGIQDILKSAEPMVSSNSLHYKPQLLKVLRGPKSQHDQLPLKNVLAVIGAISSKIVTAKLRHLCRKELYPNKLRC